MSYYDSTNIPTPSSTELKTHHLQKTLLRNSLIFTAGFSGMIVGVAASLGVVVPMMHSESAQNRALSQKLVSMAPVDSLSGDVCAAPSFSPATTTGQVLGAEVTAAPVGGQGGGVLVTPPSGGAGGGAPQTFVQNLIGGQIAKNEATIENTGPTSTNTVTETNMNTTSITNTNNISVSNSNSQHSSSGTATVDNNTNAGSATSGDASNSNSTGLNINVENK